MNRARAVLRYEACGQAARMCGRLASRLTLTGTMMSVPLEPGPVFKWRNAVKLFDWPSIGTPGPGRTYDVSRDGRRFLMIKEGRGSERQGTTSVIRVVLNWVEELKAKLPVD